LPDIVSSLIPDHLLKLSLIWIQILCAEDLQALAND
jgi:hypothetical protein